VLAVAGVVGFELQLVFLAQRDAEFERVDRIEAEAFVAEQRGVVGDVVRRGVFEVERGDDQALDFKPEGVQCVHDGRVPV